MSEEVLIYEEIPDYNNFVEYVCGKEFIVPEPNKVTKLTIGHIHVKNPKKDHPEYMNSHLPVAFTTKRSFFLVNTDEVALKEYHSKLRERIGSYKQGTG